ncbi:switch-associated protein 70-like [Diorhabda carinulata]|uniref:switch-associated protein 70-like n=1 Tax=Diorhabda carinulata TaxID=1163345 RepID=UPI0025A1FDBA|nr:switch-associated protein 70-like [Diorhabda carinulata]
MAVVLENTINCVWLAFESLQQDKSGFVHKSKLKVLTANIGTLLDLYGVERGLEHFRSTSVLNFDQFKYYLQKEVFASLPKTLQHQEIRVYENKIAEVCWLICRKKYLPRDGRILSEDSVFQIFRIFCVLAELVIDHNNDNVYQVLLHPSEVCNIAQNISSSLGCKFDEEDFSNLSVSMGNFRLAPFIAVLESRYLIEIKDEVALTEAIYDVYQKIVEDVIKKGFLSKKGYIFPTMKEYWFVLRPTELAYYTGRSEKDRKGSLPIEPGCKVEPKAGYRILLHSSERTFELGTSDHMSRLQWVSALQLASEHSGKHESYQRLQAVKRRLQRQGRIQEMIRAKFQLQQERNARQAAEGHAKELEVVVKEEARRLIELEELRAKLERLLEEETQAKRDEEIVRGLQARVLAEEWEKREELERLQEEQRVLLEEERQKRKEYEELQREKEAQLKCAEERLSQLEKERLHLDRQLKIANQQMKYTENRKEILENKLYPIVGEKVRRAHSFMPSTKEKPVVFEVRSSTLKRS